MSCSEYEGKRVVVTGCSSGIGLELAASLLALGAEVTGLSRRAPDIGLARFLPLDLSSADSVESAAAGIDAPVDALFNCAGAPPTLSSADLVKVNFLGTRLLTARIADTMSTGGAVVCISSSIGAGWRANLPQLREFVATESFEAGVRWYEQNETAAGHGYPFSKQALNVWTMQESARLIARGIRINTTSPGAVRTPLLDASEQVFPAELLRAVEHPSGRRSDVGEQVGPLLFLNSPAASYITGTDLAVDGGHVASLSVAGSW